MTRLTWSCFSEGSPSSGITRLNWVPSVISDQFERASGRRSKDLGVSRINGLRKGSLIWRRWMWNTLAKDYGYTSMTGHSTWRGRVANYPVSIIKLLDSEVRCVPIRGELIWIIILHLKETFNTTGRMFRAHSYLDWLKLILNLRLTDLRSRVVVAWSIHTVWPT